MCWDEGKTKTGIFSEVYIAASQLGLSTMIKSPLAQQKQTSTSPDGADDLVHRSSGLLVRGFAGSVWLHSSVLSADCDSRVKPRYQPVERQALVSTAHRLLQQFNKLQDSRRQHMVDPQFRNAKLEECYSRFNRVCQHCSRFCWTTVDLVLI